MNAGVAVPVVVSNVNHWVGLGPQVQLVLVSPAVSVVWLAGMPGPTAVQELLRVVSQLRQLLVFPTLTLCFQTQYELFLVQLLLTSLVVLLSLLGR